MKNPPRLVPWGICFAKEQNTRLCGATLFTKEGEDEGVLTPALFGKRVPQSRRRVFCPFICYKHPLPHSHRNLPPCHRNRKRRLYHQLRHGDKGIAGDLQGSYDLRQRLDCLL